MGLRVEALELPDVRLITPQRFSDARGYFCETYNRRAFADAGIETVFIQDNEALSGPAGVLRGLHFQVAPNPQAKLVRVIKGAIFDVAVDVREGSPTFGRWCGRILSAEAGTQLFIPAGFAHGYVTLVDDALVAYKVDHFYDKAAERGIRWDDPEIGIDWPIDRARITLSGKDEDLPYLRDADRPFPFGAATGAMNAVA